MGGGDRAGVAYRLRRRESGLALDRLPNQVAWAMILQLQRQPVSGKAARAKRTGDDVARALGRDVRRQRIGQQDGVVQPGRHLDPQFGFINHWGQELLGWDDPIGFLSNSSTALITVIVFEAWRQNGFAGGV